MAAATDIRVQSTTDTVDAGLVDGILRAGYLVAQPGDTLNYNAVGTGAALTNARAGLADVVITHAPSLEAQFVHDGYSLGLGRQIFYSDYVIVGSTSDPAGVAANASNDAVTAFEDIGVAGAASPTTVKFQSRGDNSGTNVEEQQIWGLTDNAVVPTQQATNALTDLTRREPVDGAPPAIPAWYDRSAVAIGQRANLLRTEACAAAGNGCYTIVDRGTFNKNLNDGSVTHLKIVSQNNTPSARGGQNLLINPFSVYIVNPAATFPAGAPTPDVAAATRFVNFITSAAFQSLVAGFPNALDPAFRPDAAPTLTLTAGIPQTSTSGTRVVVSGRATNNVPGAAAPAGMPLTMQASTDGGRTFQNISATAFTDNDGNFSIPFSVAPATASYRIASAQHPANTLNGTTYNEFTAASKDIGIIAVPTAATPAKPATAPVVDRRAPTVTRVVLGRRGLTFRLSEGSRVTIVIQQRVRRNGRVAFRHVQTLRRTVGRARLLTVHHKALKAGTYRVRLTVTDTAGNTRHVTRTVRVR